MAPEAKDILHSSSDGRFLYPPVKQRSETRLACLYPGSVADPIKCDIRMGRLENLPSYEAISYTWADESGDITKCKTIYLNSRPFFVTSNCEAALKRLRLRWSYRTIWMDAISIDQDNSEELGHQVQLMPEIYARALRVVIYIGEADDNSAIVLDYLRHGNSSVLLRRNPFFDTITALSDILARRYFSRVWILQEVALARQAVLVCGSTTIPWSCFTLDNLTARQMLHWSSSKLLNSFPLPPVICFGAPRYKDPDDLLAILDMARPCNALDPRDKVFALIGLITGAQAEGFMADYTLTVEQVYTSVAAYIARRVGCVAVLSRIALTNRFPRLPSWVPDWSSFSLFQPEEIILEDPNFRSGETTLKDPKPASANEFHGVLMIYGIEIGTLSVLSDGSWLTEKGFRIFLEGGGGGVQPGDALYQICNTDKEDELYREDPYWFSYPRCRQMILDGSFIPLRYTFVLRRHSENRFKITGRCRLIHPHGRVAWEEWKRKEEKLKEREWEKQLQEMRLEWQKGWELEEQLVKKQLIRKQAELQETRLEWQKEQLKEQLIKKRLKLQKELEEWKQGAKKQQELTEEQLKLQKELEEWKQEWAKKQLELHKMKLEWQKNWELEEQLMEKQLKLQKELEEWKQEWAKKHWEWHEEEEKEEWKTKWEKQLQETRLELREKMLEWQEKWELEKQLIEKQLIRKQGVLQEIGSEWANKQQELMEKKLKEKEWKMKWEKELRETRLELREKMLEWQEMWELEKQLIEKQKEIGPGWANKQRELMEKQWELEIELRKLVKKSQERKWEWEWEKKKEKEEEIKRMTKRWRVKKIEII